MSKLSKCKEVAAAAIEFAFALIMVAFAILLIGTLIEVTLL